MKYSKVESSMENKWIILLGIFGMTISYFTMMKRYYSAKTRIKELEKKVEDQKNKDE